MIFSGKQITADCGNMAACGNMVDCGRWHIQSVGFFTVIVILTTVRFQVYIIKVHSGRQL